MSSTIQWKEALDRLVCGGMLALRCCLIVASSLHVSLAIMLQVQMHYCSIFQAAFPIATRRRTLLMLLVYKKSSRTNAKCEKWNHVVAATENAAYMYTFMDGVSQENQSIIKCWIVTALANVEVEWLCEECLWYGWDALYCHTMAFWYRTSAEMCHSEISFGQIKNAVNIGFQASAWVVFFSLVSFCLILNRLNISLFDLSLHCVSATNTLDHS